ncbi:ricin-type beta-trefoil lectin domain protein [Streptomyces virginiae]|uniref:ricin-type beta-trefoil lectin domain protein n=1 Tax=Streptomyces virginiae TaxID=1961 RepID=UPI00369E4911
MQALGKCLTAQGGDAVLKTCNGDSNQKFTYRASDKALFTGTNQCLTVPNDNAVEGNDLYTCASPAATPAQQWSFSNLTSYLYDASGNRVIGSHRLEVWHLAKNEDGGNRACWNTSKQEGETRLAARSPQRRSSRSAPAARAAGPAAAAGPRSGSSCSPQRSSRRHGETPVGVRGQGSARRRAGSRCCPRCAAASAAPVDRTDGRRPADLSTAASRRGRCAVRTPGGSGSGAAARAAPLAPVRGRALRTPRAGRPSPPGPPQPRRCRRPNAPERAARKWQRDRSAQCSPGDRAEEQCSRRRGRSLFHGVSPPSAWSFRASSVRAGVGTTGGDVRAAGGNGRGTAGGSGICRRARIGERARTMSGISSRRVPAVRAGRTPIHVPKAPARSAATGRAPDVSQVLTACIRACIPAVVTIWRMDFSTICMSHETLAFPGNSGRLGFSRIAMGSRVRSGVRQGAPRSAG